eukprot:4411479-Amphidinium_carterae.1
MEQQRKQAVRPESFGVHFHEVQAAGSKLCSKNRRKGKVHDGRNQFCQTYAYNLPTRSHLEMRSKPG